jgi:glycosyltransferase involved in cell wall biosynthesis
VTGDNPSVSIILPTYNRALLLQESIRSILLQTFADFEIIVVDDGSTDNTEAAVRMFADERIKYYKRFENQGATSARNIGIKQASGTYIAFQDSDDIWLPDKLAKQMEVLLRADRDVGVVYTGYWRIINNKKNYMPVHAATSDKAAKAVSELLFLFVATPTVLIKKECLERSGMFDERLSRLQEWELWIRLAEDYRFAYIHEPLVISRYQPESITANYQALVTSFELIFEKHRRVFERDKNRLARLLAIFGRHLLNSPETLEHGRDYLWRAVALDPTNLRYLIYLLFSRLGFQTSDKLRRFYRSIREWNTRYSDSQHAFPKQHG